MAHAAMIRDLLDRASVEPAVYDLRRDYRALLVVADGIAPGASDAESEALLQQAEATVAQRAGALEDVAQIAAWRETYRAFGAKPKKYRCSLEALMRRAESGLPRVNRLTDIYNAISVLYEIPLGGEDLSRYSGPPRLLRATGEEPFDTMTDGVPAVEHPSPGEVVWCDDAGVTCRRWNWRQAHRTQLTDATTTAFFVLDALAPMTDAELFAAADALSTHLSRLGDEVTFYQRLLSFA